MPAIMQVEIGHVPLIEVPVPIRRLAPVVVSDLLPDLAGFASHGHVPVIGALAERDVFDGVPEVLPEASVAQKTPVLILPQQLVTPILDYRGGCSHCLGVAARHSNQEGRRQDWNNSHQTHFLNDATSIYLRTSGSRQYTRRGIAPGLLRAGRQCREEP